MCSDDVGFEPLSDIVARLVNGLVDRQPVQVAGDRSRSPGRQSTAAARDAAILEFVGKERSIRAPQLGFIGGVKERAAKTPTSGLTTATPGDHVAVASSIW